MTRDEILETWQHAERLAAHMIEVDIPRHKVDAVLASVARLCERKLAELERVAS